MGLWTEKLVLILLADLNIQHPFTLAVWQSGTLCYNRINLMHPQTFGRENMLSVLTFFDYKKMVVSN